MDDNILVSVIMPIHNAKQWLDRSVASALNQTMRKIEVILINDGSTDGSEYILEKWAAADKCVRVINRGNLGVSATRNEGIAKARGKYVSFIDADDYMESDMLRQMVDALEHTDADVAICDYYEENEKGYKKNIMLPWEHMTKLDNFMVENELIPDMIKVTDEDKKRYPSLDNNIAGTVWRTCIRKSFLESTGIRFDEEMSIAEDFNFCVRAFIKASGVVVVRGCLYHDVRWNSTTMASYREKQFEVGIANQKILKNFLVENGMYNSTKQRYFGSYIDEVLSAPYNFIRPGGPGFIKKIHLLKEITRQISVDDTVIEAVGSGGINLTGNQKLALKLMRHHMALTLYLLAKIRNSKYKKYEKKEND